MPTSFKSLGSNHIANTKTPTNALNPAKHFKNPIIRSDTLTPQQQDAQVKQINPMNMLKKKAQNSKNNINPSVIPFMYETSFVNIFLDFIKVY